LTVVRRVPFLHTSSASAEARNPTTIVIVVKARLSAMSMSKAVADRTIANLEIDRVVGDRIRELRRARGLSLEIVAERCDVSIGFLSQIERGMSSPSLKLLTTLADVLDVHFGTLFVTDESATVEPSSHPGKGKSKKHPTTSIVMKAGKGPRLKLWRSGIHKQLLTEPGAQLPFSYFTMHMEPGATSGGQLYQHSGNEAGLVLMGRLSLTVEDQTWLLSEGDSFFFASHKPHRFVNPSRGRTSVVMVHTPT
jgi:transcriptional regulator with XRE-family HTH domain/mannose-6-phosphate isomerase-like protein (cupin superfamily)